MALLQTCDEHGQPILPWARLVASDLTRLRFCVKEVSNLLPDPSICPYVWYDFIKHNKDQWGSFVERLYYVESVCDRTASSESTVDTSALTFRCEKCDAPYPAFATLKALNQHKRKTHGERNTMVYYARANGVCPSCGTIFVSRLQLLGHLSDTRRPRCALYVVQNCTRMSDADVSTLDVADRAARKVAYSSGHSHAIVQKAAKSANGRVIGRPSAA